MWFFTATHILPDEDLKGHYYAGSSEKVGISEVGLEAGAIKGLEARGRVSMAVPC